ncbi:MAG: DUF6875 domain-containing protein [Verrucomicrobiales bacterium]
MTSAEPAEVTGALLSKMFTPTQARSKSNLLEAGVRPDQAETVARCVEWATTFPTRRVRKRGRTEAICPMVSPSLAAGGIKFSVADVADREPRLETFDRILTSAADCFESGISLSDPRLRCLVVVIPGVRGARLLEATHPGREIKNTLLSRGILVGEFFPSCPFATTFNPRLFALRSPAPMYVLRTFLESDWRFICRIPAWQRTYRARFGEPPASLRHLGGPLWRLKTGIGWRIDALLDRLDPTRNPEVTSD